MRKAFLFPTLKMLRRGRLGWVLNQALKVLVFKYGGGIIPASSKAALGPLMGIIVVTYRCNSRCQMCPIKNRRAKANDAKSGSTQKEMTTKEMEDVIDQFVEMGTSGISFTGGEPLLRDDIFHLIGYANRLGVVTTLNTNGLLLTDDNIENLLEAEPDNVNISIDGASDETNDAIRGVKGALRKVARAISHLSRRKKELRKNTTLTIVTVVSSRNIHEIERIADLSVEIGGDKIGFIPQHSISLVPDSFVATCHDDSVTQDIVAIFSRMRKRGIIIDNSHDYLNMFNDAFKGKKFPIRCHAGYTSLVVDCYHNVFPCWPLVESGSPVECVRLRDLVEFWRSEEYEDIRHWTEKCRECFWNCHAELSILCRGI